MSLARLPDEMITHILSFADTYSIVAWRNTSRRQYSIALYILHTDLHRCLGHYGDATMLTMLLKSMRGYIIGVPAFLLHIDSQDTPPPSQAFHEPQFHPHILSPHLDAVRVQTQATLQQRTSSRG